MSLTTPATSRAPGSSRPGDGGSALRISTHRSGSAMVVHAVGEIDASNEGTWQRLLGGIITAAAPPGPIVVDVRGLDFMGCCAFAVLVRQAQRCRRRGIRLHLVSHQPIVARMVDLCGLHPLLPTHPTIGKALEQRHGQPIR